MKKNSLLFFLLLIISCNKKMSNDIKSTEDVKVEYTREWLEYVYPSSDITEQVEVYISQKNDTFFHQRKLFNNKILDTSKSQFYHINFKRNNNINSGRITIFSDLDYKIKSPLIEKQMLFYIFKYSKDSVTVISFESKNKNYIDFEFESVNDTIVGIIREERQIDTIVNGKKLVRIIESLYPVDNKAKTSNPFIEAFELN